MKSTGDRHLVLWPLVCLLPLVGACQGPPRPGPEEIRLALEEVRLGAAPKAIGRLEQLIEIHPQGRIGDKAALVLGRILIDREQHKEALEPLARAVRGRVAPHYAALLWVQAIADGGLEELYPDALEEAAGLSANGQARPLVRQEAQYIAIKLHSARQEWPRIQSSGSEFLDRWPNSEHLGEVRWLTAEAYNQSDRRSVAAELYATIWYQHPTSPWAVEARQRLSARERATAGRRLSADALIEFIEALQGVGLHQAALEEVDRFSANAPRHPATDLVLLQRVKSLHALRRNFECVAAVEELRRRYRSSQQLPRAAIYAIKALRRNNNTELIRTWVSWIVENYPNSPEAFEALFNLGVYLTNVVGDEQGLTVLERLIETGGEDPHVDNALWKAAWIHRRRGHMPFAIATLERLLDEYPDSDFRRAAMYWSGRFVAEDDTDRAISRFRQCVEEFPHDYYGHQALENLLAAGVRPRQIGSRAVFPSIGLLDDLAAASELGETLQAAAYLKSVGLYRFAAAELDEFDGPYDDPALQFARADLYSRAGDPWAAIDIVNRYFRSFVVSGSQDPDLVPREFWYIVFPYNHRASIQRAIHESGLEGTGIDPYLVAALIRQESRFLPSAISPVGALGLMQLMPGTADSIANERGLPPPNRSELFNPSTNIRYGTFYLAQLVSRFQGDWFPAICSYNAGPSAVKRWWHDRPPGQAIDEFVENIPYVATRQYIKRILGDYKNYEWLYQQDV